MKAIAYLLLRGTANYRGDIYKFTIASVRQNKPDRKANEIAVKLILEVPEDAFEDYMPECTVKVSADALLKPGIKAAISSCSKESLEELAELVNQRIRELVEEEETNDTAF